MNFRWLFVFSFLLLSFTLPLTCYSQQPLPVTGPTYPSLKLSGFGDLNFSSVDESGFKKGFSQGQFIFHVSSALSGRTSFFSEISLTTIKSSTGANSVLSNIERAIIQFAYHDSFRVSIGQYHTPINWWNTTFHHGLWLQTTIQRPEITKFGGQFIPVHFIGGMIGGMVPIQGINFGYNLGLGNGRDSSIGGAGSAGDINNNRAWLINLFVRPDRLYWLQVGGSFYRDKIDLSGGQEFREWIAGGHIAWQKENPEFIAEFANVNHREITGGSHTNSLAYYIQVAYRLPGGATPWKPYYRYEYSSIPGSELVFDRSKINRRISTVGIRFDWSDLAALKAEYRNIKRYNQPRYNGGFVQVSFTF